MTDKAFVCRCEDVTVKDVESAIDAGHADIESVKRYTGLGTGWCQGKQCVSNCAQLLARRNLPAEPFTPRPPFHPVELGKLARIFETENDD